MSSVGQLLKLSSRSQTTYRLTSCKAELHFQALKLLRSSTSRSARTPRPARRDIEAKECDRMALLEETVGIYCWTDKLPGFSGILKQRYTDFLVNEVDTGGHVVRLTSLQALALPKPEPQLAASTAVLSEEEKFSDEYPQAGIEAAVRDFAAVAGEANAQLLADFLAQALQPQPGDEDTAAAATSAGADAAEAAASAATARPAAAEAPPPPTAAVLETSMAVAAAAEMAGAPENEKKPFIRVQRTFSLQPVADKVARTAVHLFFKNEPRLPRLRTETATNHSGYASSAPSGGVVQVTLVRGKRKAGAMSYSADPRERQEQSWPGGPDRKFCRFVLQKENMDTQAALGLLSRMLHCKPSNFAFAGTKDKRAITVQQVTAYRIPDSRLAYTNTKLRGAQLGNFEYVELPLALGASGGNQFEVTLRAVKDATPDQVAAAAEGIRKSGFINYFGLQRFGSGAVPTHKVGTLLLKGEFRAAVMLLMSPRPGHEAADISDARRRYTKDGDAAGAREGLPRFLVAESAVMEFMAEKDPANWLGAICAIPKNLRSMYVHAYQSYLWNTAASHRVETFGSSSVIAGDLVLQRAAEFHEAGSRSFDERSTERLGAVHVVTAAEAAAGAFSMEDVVLPLAGGKVQYPQHQTAEVYTETAAKDGISLESSCHAVREFQITALAGDYRRLLHKPAELEWALLQYVDADAQLTAPDSALACGAPELLVGNPDIAVLSSSDGYLQPLAAGSATDGRLRPHMALQLRFKLPPSGYATMLVRQLMKGSTSIGAHKKLTEEAAAAVAAAKAAIDAA